jgi:hypothetical protein
MGAKEEMLRPSFAIACEGLLASSQEIAFSRSHLLFVVRMTGFGAPAPPNTLSRMQMRTKKKCGSKSTQPPSKTKTKKISWEGFHTKLRGEQQNNADTLVCLLSLNSWTGIPCSFCLFLAVNSLTRDNISHNTNMVKQGIQTSTQRRYAHPLISTGCVFLAVPH